MSDIHQACCLPSVLVQNTTAFQGGQHERDYTVVTREDIDHGVASLTTTLIQSEHGAFTAQIRAHEALAAPYCTRSVTADPQAGAEAAAVTIIVSEQCTAIAYDAVALYEDDERNARGEQIAKRPACKKLLDDTQAGDVHIVIVHTLDRWSRNVMVTLQSFRILSQSRKAFISLSEQIDYSTPEGMLQLTNLAAFAAYFSDMLAKHTSKGKGERAAQGLYNGDVPFGYRWTGPKTPPEHDPDEYPGLRRLGELRIQGFTADEIAERLNVAGYRTGSKRFGARPFTTDTVTAMLRTEFYAAFAPGDDRGTVRYHDQRHRGLHQAAFTYEEWQQIRAITPSIRPVLYRNNCFSNTTTQHQSPPSHRFGWHP